MFNNEHSTVLVFLCWSHSEPDIVSAMYSLFLRGPACFGLSLSLFACGATPETSAPEAAVAEQTTEAPTAIFAVSSTSWVDGGTIPHANAFCIPAEEGHVGLGTNVNPALAWTDAPEGTKSFAIVMRDPDVPSKMDDVNQEGKTVASDLERSTFVHWLLVDVPVSSTGMEAGADSDSITPKGKPPGPSAAGNRGINDYTKWFAADKNMAGNYGGYDGPCPPWNDERVHNYVTTVYALDVETLEVNANFTLDVMSTAMEGHVLAEASITGQYSLNPSVTVPAAQ